MARAKKPHFTKPDETEAAAPAPVAVTRKTVAAVEDYSALNVPLEVVLAAGLRNGMQPQAIHEAIKAVMIARALHQ